MKMYLHVFLLSLILAAPGYAQSWQPPSDAQRCPSKWGAADQRGSGNHMKPDSVLRAVKLIRTGEVLELGQVLRTDMPFSVGRRFEMHAQAHEHEHRVEPPRQQ